MRELKLSPLAFREGGLIPLRHTGHGKDIPPKFRLNGSQEGAVSPVIIMSDIDYPVPACNHWMIQNLPVMTIVPENIPCDPQLESLGSTMQGHGYGKNRYRGPRPPFHWSHRYSYHAYVLGCLLGLPSTADKRDLLSTMEGHIFQQVVLTGHYR